MSKTAQDADALAARSEALYRAGKLAEAETALRKLAGLLPTHPMVHYNLARVCKDRGRPDAAAQALRKAVTLAPAMVEAWLNLGTLLGEAGRWAEAAEAFEAGLKARPDSWQLLASLGRVRAAQGRGKEAETLLRQALSMAPDSPPVLVNLGNLLSDKGEMVEAVALLDCALALAPAMTEALTGAGNAARKAGEPGRALDFYRRAAESRPQDLALRARLAEARLGLCDWSGVAALRDEVIAPALKANPAAIGPMMSLAFPLALSFKELAAFARFRAEAAEAEAKPLKALIRTPKPGPRERLTIGYLSADFHDHPTAHLMRGMFAAHDRQRFRVVVLSLGPDDGSSWRQSINSEADAFVDLAGLDLAEAAQAVQAAGVDILVDINVHTRGNRLALTALRPAPVSVNWLGLPGTSGAGFMDWALVDSVTCPPGAESQFVERVAVLPHCYQPNDRAQAINEPIPSRAQCGLPETGVVFCCFNQAFKIEPVMFGRWMSVLNRVPGSVLWLLDGGADMAANLRREARARGVDPDRLIFAPRLPKSEHLARHRNADLFLDTLYYNAHTTASDALWAGVPVLTAPGESFASRVAASLLVNVGLPELIRPDLDDYEETAVRLGLDPAAQTELKARLAANRLCAPLFDTEGFVRDMERAFQMIWAEACAGRKTRRLEIPSA